MLTRSLEIQYPLQARWRSERNQDGVQPAPVRSLLLDLVGEQAHQFCQALDDLLPVDDARVVDV
jgi:hypothetical protein